MIKDFTHPPLTARAIPFWSWNETMEAAEIRRQIAAIQAGGWAGAFLHARIGLRTEYLGEDWFAACGVAIDECRKRGLQVWLYDEEGWPSGISGGSVPLADPAFRHKALFARPVGVAPPTDSVALGSPKDGLQLWHWTAPLGSWRFNGVCFADLLSQTAMARFCEDAYASYHRRFAADYGATIAAEFLDEPSAMVSVLVPAGSVAWTPELPAAFTRQHGYDPLPCLHLLFTDRPGSTRLRLHLAQTISHLFEVNFTRQLGRWCEAHGIALTGHFMEGSLFVQQVGNNRVMPNYRHQAIPGIDHLYLQVSEVITAKQCHAVVNQYAKPQMLCETFGVAGQHLTFAERWWMAMHLLSLGVTRFVPHLALYTMAGCRKRDFPPNLFVQQPWWPLNEAIETPLARLGAALSQGRPRAEALVLHPQDSAAAAWHLRTDWDEPAALVTCVDPVTPEAKNRITELDRQFSAVVGALQSAQRLADLGDEGLLADDGSVVVTAGGPVLRLGAMDYPAVILPGMITVGPATLRLLTEFHDSGGPIICVGDLPTLVDGEPSPPLDALLATSYRATPDGLPALLARLIPPLVRLDATLSIDEVYVLVRDLDDGGRLVFLADRRRIGPVTKITLHLEGGFRSAWCLDPHTGSETCVTSDSADRLSLDVHPADGILLRLDPGAAGLGFSAAISHSAATARQSEPSPPATWAVERLDDNALTLDLACWREALDQPFTTTPIPVVAIQGRLDQLRYSGPLTLRYSFTSDGLSPGRRIHLVVEYPERYWISVNGVAVTYAGLPPYRDHRFLPLDLTALVRPGINLVEMHLAEFRWAEGEAPRERQADRTGTEIEAVYLVGDFHVAGRMIADGPSPVTEVTPFSSGPQAIPPRTLHYLAPGGTITDPKPLAWGDVTPQGLPFYAGRLRWTASLPEPLTGEGWHLALDDHDAVVLAVEVDGRQAQAIFAPPMAVPLPAGTRTIMVTAFSSLRNLLGPHHHEAGVIFPRFRGPMVWGTLLGMPLMSAKRCTDLCGRDAVGQAERIPAGNGSEDLGINKPLQSSLVAGSEDRVQVAAVSH